MYLSAPDEQTGCCASDTATVPACCSTGIRNEGVGREAKPNSSLDEMKLKSEDGKASMAEVAQKMAASSTGITDFNEWAGETSNFQDIDTHLTNSLLGSFQIYAVKPAE